MGLFTGQVGYAWNSALLYVKGGAAVANQRFDIFNTATGIGLGQAERTRWGGVVGVGLEYGFAPNWTAGIEYDYLFRESDSRTFLTPNLAELASVTANTRYGYQHDHWPHQLQVWRLRCPDCSQVLIWSAYSQQTKAPALSGAFLLPEVDLRSRELNGCALVFSKK